MKHDSADSFETAKGIANFGSLRFDPLVLKNRASVSSLDES